MERAKHGLAILGREAFESEVAAIMQQPSSLSPTQTAHHHCLLLLDLEVSVQYSAIGIQGSRRQPLVVFVVLLPYLYTTVVFIHAQCVG
jgi:hypothetical protein